jgi:hypothetical protein
LSFPIIFNFLKKASGFYEKTTTCQSIFLKSLDIFTWLSLFSYSILPSPKVHKLTDVLIEIVGSSFLIVFLFFHPNPSVRLSRTYGCMNGLVEFVHHPTTSGAAHALIEFFCG